MFIHLAEAVVSLKSDWRVVSITNVRHTLPSLALGSFVGCSQYTANLFIYMYIYYMSLGLHVSTPFILGHHQVPRLIALLTCNASCGMANAKISHTTTGIASEQSN